MMTTVVIGIRGSVVEEVMSQAGLEKVEVPGPRNGWELWVRRPRMVRLPAGKAMIGKVCGIWSPLWLHARDTPVRCTLPAVSLDDGRQWECWWELAVV